VLYNILYYIILHLYIFHISHFIFQRPVSKQYRYTHISITMTNELAIAYSAISISISGRLIFMYLLYTKKSTNLYSLIFSIMNMVSSSLWITYSQTIIDKPLFIRSSCDLILFSISTIYIMSNRLGLNTIQPDIPL